MSLIRAGLAAIALVTSAGAAWAQSAVTLTAAPTTANLPDGQSVPMWGYFCSAPSDGVSCTAMNGTAQTGSAWQPPLIRVPAGASLTIKLVNNLTFGAGDQNVPTSIVIDGQVGGGLGDPPARMASPTHDAQGTTWPGSAGTPTASSCGDGTFADTGTFCPPVQGLRVRSFGKEVAAGASNSALTWNNLRPGTYLIHTGTQPSIQHPMGLYGVLVVTEDPLKCSLTPQCAYPSSPTNAASGTAYDADVPLLFSEIDPEQNRAVDAAVHTGGFNATTPWAGPGACKGGAAACYPPAVNYSPRYYLINGTSFDRTNAAASTFSVPASLADPTASLSGNVLLRIVNAGQRTHVPAVVGANLTPLAEDGNKVSTAMGVQSSLPMAPGKTFDAIIHPAHVSATAYDGATLPVFDRQLSLSTNNQRDGGMQAYIAVGAGAAVGTVGSSSSAVLLSAPTNLTFYCIAGNSLSVTEASKGLLRGVTGASGVALPALPAFTGDVSAATLSLNADGTFSYKPSTTAVSGNTCGGSFRFLVNGTSPATATIAQCDANAGNGLNGCTLAAPPSANDFVVVSQVATRYTSPPPGVLAHVTNPSNQALTAVVVPGKVNQDGSFIAAGPGSPSVCASAPSGVPAGASCVAVPYTAKNAQGRTGSATAYVAFLPASHLAVTVQDGPTGNPVTDYRWIIEEDRTFWVDPKCQVNSTARPTDSYGRPCPDLPVESLGYNFHSANMPVIAAGCWGGTSNPHPVSCEAGQKLQGNDAVCDVGNGVCRTEPGVSRVPVNPADVHLDPNKRYFLSILPGDAINPTISGFGGTAKDCAPYPTPIDWALYDPTTGASGNCGHEMGGTQVAPGTLAVTVNLQQIPLPTAKISVFVFEDDNPVNGENDAGGGVDVIAPNEPGLGGFEIKLFDQAGQLGDNTGQITYDEFNQPVSNSLAGYIDPLTGFDACPITTRADKLIGMIPTCPKYESDGVTPSPMAGQVVIDHLYPGLYEIQAYPAADRISRGEQWLQTNTLDGGKPHEAFIKPNEPGYFQEFGPGGYHVAIGFANPAVINARKAEVCNAPIPTPVGWTTPCTNKLVVEVSNNHMSRTPDQRTYDSETYDHYSFTQCYVSIGPADDKDFAFENCVLTTDAKGTHATATFNNMPPGTFKMTVFDQWNDIMLDGLVGTVEIGSGTPTKKFPVTQWRTNLYTRTYIDDPAAPNPGVSDDSKPGLALVNTNIRYRDGSIAFFNNTDLNGYAGFNEVFPFMNWLVVETTQTRYKPTWTHTVYDAGGPVDCSSMAKDLDGNTLCSTVAANLANTNVRVPLPAALRVPGAKYCDDADCLLATANGKSTGTLFPAQAFGNTIGWQGLLGQNTFIEFGVKPFKKNENGGIHGQVVYQSTRPFDDPSLLLQLSWEPGIPRATINLYSKSVDAQGNEVLKLVDTTKSASWDDWAQGFRTGADGVTPLNAGSGATAGNVPNMNCPGQAADSPFFATLKNSKMWLDAAKSPLAYESQFKCYDGWSQLNQAQPAPYDGYYKFPSVVGIDPDTGKPSKTNCDVNVCTTNPDDGAPMLPPGTYVVEVVVPTGYELVKEEDKNILMGDVYVAPVTQQFAGFGNIFIMPDQAAVNSAYNSVNPNGLNPTNNLGAAPRHEGDTGSIEAFWPCVGALRQVPDFNSEFPGAQQAAPFAGATRRLCDRKEVKLTDEASVLAKFFLFSDTHIAGHFTGTITNDFASEFDPFSPQFGEKFGPPNLPVGLRDFNGNEVARVYSDQWGIYNGLYFSTWSPNPPNPTGYAPQMSIACMNDPGPIMVNGVSMTDPSYNPAYSNFCYEQPFMPGTTTYMDTPVIPTQAFADGYNLPDTEYPDQTPAIKSVLNSAGQGPWVSAAIAAKSASVQIVVGGVNRCRAGANRCNNPSSLSSVTINGASVMTPAVTCVPDGSAPDCSNASQSARNSTFATVLASRISAAGYTVSRSGATLTITRSAPGAAGNNVPVVVTTANMTDVGAFAFTGGNDATGGTGMGITIYALGDKTVQNPHFAGPNATAFPYNQKTIPRHYGFGGAGSAVLVAPDGVTTANLTIGSWGDMAISATVPTLTSAFNCKVQQRGAPTSQCGQLVITRADNGKRTVDAITVTVGGSAPWIVTEKAVTSLAGKKVQDYGANFGRMNLVLGATNQSPIQVALDSADPGDLILVQPGTYRENLIMWKPVRLQGVGAASVTVNADAHPAGHMDQWRRQMVCVFGLTMEGIPNMGNDQALFDPSSQYSCPNDMWLKGDRIPFEAITGWQASGNGNLAQVLQEPTLLGAYEGAGVTVVGRGVREPAGTDNFWGQDPTAAGAFPDGAVYLTDGISNLGNVNASAADCAQHRGAVDGDDYGTSNYRCNPSSIDGLSILNSSQGGGGLFIHGWSHNLEVSNNRISSNHGTLAGAINLGNGETPPVFVNDGTTCNTGVNPQPLCPPIYSGVNNPNGRTIPFGFNTNVRVHHNMLWNNASIGDALFTGTPAGAGGVTVSSGGDSYKIDHNWIAGNLTTGDGGGIQTLGVNFNGTIANNVVLFNQSTNPTLPTNGGGIVIQGANEPRTFQGTECGGATDHDCPPGLGDGTGGGLLIDANLIYGNSAESGTGGGIALEQISGSEVIAFPTTPNEWYGVTLTNNIIVNNVAGYDGGGVSMRDALKVSLVNNTIASNDTTASAGVLFKTLAAINASSPPPGCNSTTDPTAPQNPSCLGRDAPHGPQPSGLVTMAHTQNLNDAINALPGSLTSNATPRLVCPNGFGYANGSGTGDNARNNADCIVFSRPALVNDLFWQNRTFHVDLSTAPQAANALTSQQNLVVIAPGLATNHTPLASQSYSGECPAGASYWDIGLRTDDVNAGLISAAVTPAFPATNRLVITNSILTGTGDISALNDLIASASNRVGVANPVNEQICNGARVPPEYCGVLDVTGGQNGAASCKGFNAPPGASESTSTSALFVFNGIQPTATVDEGHNWLNLVYGPLTLARPKVSTPTKGEMMLTAASTGLDNGAYSIPISSAAVGGGVAQSANNHDFFGNSRPTSGSVAIGAVERQALAIVSVSPTSLTLSTRQGTTSATQNLTVSNTGLGAFTGLTLAFGDNAFTRAGGTCTATLGANSTCTIAIRFTAPSTAGTTTSTATITGNATVTGSPVALTGVSQAATSTATVSPSPLAFGNWATGTTSNVRTLTVTNTGNSPLAGGTVTGFAAPFTRVNTGNGNCGATLAVGASCTIRVQFSPTAAVASSVNVTVAYTGATVTPTPAVLSGTGVATRAAVTVTPNPAAINLPTLAGGNCLTNLAACTGTTTVTFTNTAAAGGSQVNVTNVGATGSGGTILNGWSFTVDSNTCVGVALAPGATCTATVRFNNSVTGAARATARTGAVTFTDNGVASPQSGVLNGNTVL
jgi:hypothetical protein